MSDKCHDLYTRWAFRHLAIVRDTQRQFLGHGDAMQLSTALNTAFEQLANNDSAYKQALAIEQELREHGFEIRKIDE